MPILKKSVKNPDRAYFFMGPAEKEACCHNGYILHVKWKQETSNMLLQKYGCRKVCDDTDKFDKNHCTFEIDVVRITDDEGKVQQVRNYHAAHKDDYNYYNCILFA